jgi:hypothetical protein
MCNPQRIETCQLAYLPISRPADIRSAKSISGSESGLLHKYQKGLTKILSSYSILQTSKI